MKKVCVSKREKKERFAATKINPDKKKCVKKQFQGSTLVAKIKLWNFFVQIQLRFYDFVPEGVKSDTFLSMDERSQVVFYSLMAYREIFIVPLSLIRILKQWISWNVSYVMPRIMAYTKHKCIIQNADPLTYRHFSWENGIQIVSVFKSDNKKLKRFSK